MKQATPFDISLNHLLWKRGLICKILYILIPFLLIGVFAVILDQEQAFIVENTYGFLEDCTNCYMLCYIFFFVYFLNGFFLPYFHKQVEMFGSKVKYRIRQKYSLNISIAYWIVLMCSVLISACSIAFIYTANQTGDKNWYSKLNNIELSYYSFLIVMAWIMSVRLFAHVLINTVSIYKYLQHDIEKLDYYNEDKKCGLKGIYNSLAASVGFGFYFLIAVAVIVYSDFNAKAKHGIDLLAYKCGVEIIVFAVIFAAVYFAIIGITYINLNRTLKMKIENKIKNTNLCRAKVNYLNKIAGTSISLNEICTFVFTVLFPGAFAIIQVALTMK